MKPKHTILLTLCLICLLLLPAAAAADAVTYSGKTYTTYDQIYASTTLSSSEKLSLVQEMAGWTEELAAYVEWKNSGGLAAYQAAVSGGNSTSGDYGWDEAPGDGLGDGGTSIEPEYSYQERQAYDAAYAAYLAEFEGNYAATAAYTGNGSGTEADPYIITTPAELQSIRDDLSAHYKLGNDIDMSSFSWSKISSFSGSLNGNGYKISNLQLTLTNHGGFIELTNGYIKNVDFLNVDLTTSASAWVSLISLSNSEITQCNFDYSCSGSAYFALIYGVGTVSNCYFNAYSSNSIDIVVMQNGNGGELAFSDSYITGSLIPKTYYSGVGRVGSNTVTGFSIDSICNLMSMMNGDSTSRRISIPDSGKYGTLTNNYANGDMVFRGSTTSGTTTDMNGQNVYASTYNTESFWRNTMGWDFSTIWTWDSELNLPKLQIFASKPPTISAISATPATGGQLTEYTLSVTATTEAAGGIASYQWYGRIGSSGEWQAISDGTSATYQFVPGDQALGDIYFKAVVTGADGGVVDSYDAGFVNVKITVVLAPQITSPAATPATGPLSQTVQLSASVTSTETVTYQWQELIGSTWTNISGATAATATVNIADSAATTHSYRLAATNIGGTAYSSTVTYQSVAPPVFSAFQVSPLSGGVPLEVSFSATASDTSGYRWEYSTDGNIWVQMASGASGSYTFTAEGVYYIRVIATGTGGSTTSASATVTASLLLPEFTQISASPTSGVAPFAVTLSASATNDATFIWQMQSGSSWVQIGSGSPLTYTIPSGTSAGIVYFRAVATNQYGSTTSQTLAVEVGAAPAAEIASPAPGAVFGSNRLISFAAADAGAGVTYSWNFGDGQTGSGRTVTHSYSEIGFFMVTLTTSSQFGSSEDVVRIEIVEASGDIWLASTDVSSSGVTLQATIEVSPVSSGTLVWFELESMSGTVVYKSPQLSYSGPVSYTASGLPLMAGESYRAVAYSNYYGYSIPVQVTLVDAVQPPHELLGNAWNDGLNREPFNVSALVAAGVGVYGGALGGGAVGAAVAFGVIVMFVLVGLWLRQQDIVIPLTLTLIAGWFVIGNLPGDWQPIAYTLMVVCVVAIFFYLFRKRIE